MIGKVWRLSTKAKFKEVGLKVFIISFAMHSDKHRVKNGRPWLFDNHIYVIEPFDGYTQLKDMKFDRASLWIQLHQFSFMTMSRKCGEHVGRTIGEVELVDVDEDDHWMGPESMSENSNGPHKTGSSRLNCNNKRHQILDSGEI